MHVSTCVGGEGRSRQRGQGQVSANPTKVPSRMGAGKAGTRLPPEGHVYEGVEGQKVGAHEEKGSAGGMQTGAGARRDAQTPGRQTQQGGQQEGAPDSLHCNSQREPLSRERRPLVSWVSEQKPDCVQREMAGVSNQVGVSAR